MSTVRLPAAVDQLPDAAAKDIVAEAERLGKKLRERMSKSLGLPPLLERRRQEYLLIDEIFGLQPAFDRVLVYQLPEKWLDGGVTSGGIVIPESYQQRREKESNRGILISAGARAMDALLSNGIEPGHIINYLFHAPWSVPVARVGTEVRLTVLNAGDILGSEDLAKNLREKKVQLKLDPELMETKFFDARGNIWTPKQAWHGDDY